VEIGAVKKKTTDKIASRRLRPGSCEHEHREHLTGNTWQCIDCGEQWDVDPNDHPEDAEDWA
jgi:hypothetical protein